MANRTGREDPGVEQTRSRAIPYLEKVTETDEGTLVVKMTRAGAAVLAEDALQIAWNDDDSDMAGAGSALTQAAAGMIKDDAEDE
ncbi:MAG: hypothetical protein V4719_00950 [Planctomycetota bacterium]